MPTNYTPQLGLSLPTQGELSGTWGDVTNTSMTSLVDTAIAGTTTLSTDADVTLTATVGAANQARAAILLCNGARTVVRNLTAPATGKIYYVINATTGGFAVVIRGVGPTTGVSVPAGKLMVVVWNGSDFVPAGGDATTLSGILAIANGGTGATTAAAAVTALGAAPEASPTFTGTPAAPTPGTNVNTTQIPTTAWVNTYYAAKASPTFTGNVTVPTPVATTDAVSKAYADGLSFATALPAQAGNGNKFITTDGTTARWATATPIRVARTSNTILAATDLAYLFDLSGTFTQTLTAAATLGTSWAVLLRNTGNGTITIDPNGSELIDGLATYSLLPGYTIQLICTGTGFTVLVIKARSYANMVQYTASNTFVVPQDVYVIRGYAFGRGAAGSAGGGGAGGGCGYGDIAVIPGQSVSVSITSGIATVAVGGTTMLLANPGSGIVGGSGGAHSSVTHGGSATGGAGAGGAQTGGASSGSPLGNGFAATASQAGSGWGGVGANGGGGGVGAAGSASGGGGDGLPVPSTDPLLADLTGRGGTSGYTSAGNGGAGGPGGGGGRGDGSGASAGNGGFGGGGGYATTLGRGGDGGFGGGGGGANNGTGGAGGFGGGGSGSGVGGAAVIRIYY